MNELLVRREANKIVRYGIAFRDAREIVEVAISTCKSDDIQMAVEYAITLRYNIKINTKANC